MNREEVLKQLQSIFRDILKKDNVCIDESSTSKDVDGWDSLTHMQIIAQIEKQFRSNVSISGRSLSSRMSAICAVPY